jgi:hypothetical protein
MHRAFKLSALGAWVKSLLVVALRLVSAYHPNGHSAGALP